MGWNATLQSTRELNRFDVNRCKILSGQQVNIEQSKVIFKLDCAHPRAIALNPFWAPGTRVSLDGQLIKSWRTVDDPRIHILVPQGETVITVRFPVWKTTIADTLNKWILKPQP